MAGYLVFTHRVVCSWFNLFTHALVKRLSLADARQSFVISLLLALILFASTPAFALPNSGPSSECRTARANPWAEEVFSQSLSSDRNYCPTARETWDKFIDLAYQKCHHSYVGARLNPLEKITSGSDKESGWTLFKSLYLWPGSLKAASLKTDSTIKLVRCLSMAAAEVVPASDPDRGLYKDAVKVGFHGLSMYFVSKSLLTSTPLSSWGKLQKMSFSSSFQDRKNDVERLIGRIDLLHETRVSERQEKIVQTLVGQCNVDTAKKEILALKLEQQRFLENQIKSRKFAEQSYRCSLKGEHGVFDGVYSAYMESSRDRAAEGECRAAISLNDSWKVYTDGISYVERERKTLRRQYVREASAYAQAIAACDFEAADKQLLRLAQVASQRCGKGLDPLVTKYSALDGALREDIEELRDVAAEEQDVSFRPACMMGEMSHFGVVSYTMAHSMSFLGFALLGIIGLRGFSTIWLRQLKNRAEKKYLNWRK